MRCSPRSNREAVRGELRVHPVADVAEVLELALEPAPLTAAA
jgi:ATP-dependent Lon protease